ncbi:hypothetical protein Nepgr_007329 [Nepenthes gracilis]|uniref:Uncharacterized protein n=1 Tax=Nepenthes gracilis TaxID=150966 RepID=A0AAD3XI92_NEPGR|nr:hypothetical protein Nepgr_007329 [Nepenthes gracilis]
MGPTKPRSFTSTEGGSMKPKTKAQHEEDYKGIIAAAKGSIKAKQFSAQLIPRFFKYFPQLSDSAIDARLDLYEEEEIGPLHVKSPSFVGDKRINLSWKEATQSSTPSTTTAAGKESLWCWGLTKPACEMSAARHILWRKRWWKGKREMVGWLSQRKGLSVAVVPIPLQPLQLSITLLHQNFYHPIFHRRFSRGPSVATLLGFP